MSSGEPGYQSNPAVPQIGEVAHAVLDQAGVVDVDPGHLLVASRVPDADEGQPGVMQPTGTRVLQADLHENHTVHAALRNQPLEGTVVIPAGRGQQHIQVDPGGGVDHAGDEVQLHVREPVRRRAG